MINLEDTIDEYLYPQSKILKSFSVPRKYYNNELKELRDYFWFMDYENKKFIFSKILNDNGILYSCYSINLKLLDINVYRYDYFALILIDKFNDPKNYYFYIVDKELELKKEDDKFVKIYR